MNDTDQIRIMAALVAMGAAVVIAAATSLASSYKNRRQVAREVERTERETLQEEMSGFAKHFEDMSSRLLVEQARRALETKPPRPASSHHFASRVEIDRENHEVVIDGVRLPYWLREEPEVENLEDLPVTMVRLSIMVDGTVTIKGEGRTETHDPEMGHVRTWVRRMAEESVARDLPWLKVDWEPIR